jgi:hypothetical protein
MFIPKEPTLYGINKTIAPTVIHENPEFYQNKTPYKGVCWWDTHTFKGSPVGCPIRYTNYDHKHHFVLQGFFCSWNCALSYGMHNSNYSRQRLELPTWIRYLAKCRLGGTNKRSKPPTIENFIVRRAPHWCVLKRFGGTLTVKEFRENSCTDRDTSYLIVQPNNVRITPHGIHCIVKQRSKRARQYLDFSNSSKHFKSTQSNKKRIKRSIEHVRSNERKSGFNVDIDRNHLLRRLGIVRRTG